MTPLTYEDSYDKLQRETTHWRITEGMSTDALELSAGASTEANELLDLVLKAKWGSQKKDYKDACADAVGDTIIFLAGVCQTLGLRLGDCVDQAWEEVQKRDKSRYDDKYSSTSDD